MEPEYYRFVHHADNKTTSHKVRAVAWTELLDDFHSFLLCCGFSLSRQDISDYFNEEETNA